MTGKVHGLAPRAVYYARLGSAVGVALALAASTLAFGTIGYHALFPGIDWLDALHQSAMLLAGMGPVLPEDPALLGPGAKLFDSAYALLCAGVLFGATGMVLTPVVHRALHRFRLEDTGE